MECGVLGPEMQSGNSGNSKTNLHVNFKDKGETKERREKYLTAKYGSHQMTLIRKRLAVEMWLYEELQKLFEVEVVRQNEVDVDIDELLDMENDDQRKSHLKILLKDAKSELDVKKFIQNLLEKTKTL